jgi:signal transduction histidine kinase/CheY-like chemotaxis protein
MRLKTIILILTVLGSFLNIKAQTFTKSQQDSLMGIWKDATQQDTIRLNAIHKIAMTGFRYKNPDSAFYYAQLQYNFAKSIKNKAFQVRALNVQGDYYILQGDPDNALDILNKALKLSEKLNNKKPKLNTLGNISRTFESKGDFEKALEYNLLKLKISEEIQDQSGMGMSLVDIGKNYVRKGDLTSGLKYLKRGHKIFVELNNKHYIARSQSVMANVYMQLENPEEALKLFTLNLSYFEAIGNKTYVAACSSNLGGIYVSQGNTKKGLEYLEKALVHFEETKNIPYLASLYQNMGLIYHREGNLELALECANKSLKLSKKTNNKNAVAYAKQKIGIILAEQGKYNQAILYGNEALVFFKDTDDLLNVSLTSKSLINSYKAKNNYKKAFEMNNLYFQMRDSLNSRENQKAIIELQVQSDYDKQKAIDDIENQKEIALEEAKTESLQFISLAIGIGLILISILAYTIFNKLKETRKQKAIIEEQKKKVEQSEKYKEQFLANMSHEIRTPMHAISGMINILERNEHPSTQDVYLNAMRTSSDNLVVILNDVLDLSKIEAGKLEIESIAMNPRLVIENVIQILKFKAEEKGLTLSYNVANDIPDLVMGDPTRLNQVLINLVGNAIKFTEKGTVDLVLKIENSQLHFKVMDTGIGIAQSQQEHVFGAFEQAKDSTTRHFGGTGLGLSISKQLVELQEGYIWVDSTEGVGSSFYITLPLHVAQEDAVGAGLISEEKLKNMAASLEGIRILLAEDNPFNQMIALDDLSYYIKGVSIDTVENGLMAIAQFNTAAYDLILMDVQMPEMNGFEATLRIRKIENQKSSTSRIPIIAMTASLLKTEIDSCYKAGMDNYIPKPYSLEELIGPIFKELRS